MKPAKHKAHAHRVSLMIETKSETLPELHVCHSCHNRACVNPAHLHLGTLQENVAESVLADRYKKGIDIHSAILTEEDVLFIKSNPNISVKELMKKFNVGMSTIYKLKQNRSWKHISIITHNVEVQ